MHDVMESSRRAVDEETKGQIGRAGSCRRVARLAAPMMYVALVTLKRDHTFARPHLSLHLSCRTLTPTVDPSPRSTSSMGNRVHRSLLPKVCSHTSASARRQIAVFLGLVVLTRKLRFMEHRCCAAPMQHFFCPSPSVCPFFLSTA